MTSLGRYSYKRLGYGPCAPHIPRTFTPGGLLNGVKQIVCTTVKYQLLTHLNFQMSN